MTAQGGICFYCHELAALLDTTQVLFVYGFSKLKNKVPLHHKHKMLFFEE
jgi:hypothetical protein